MDHLPGVIRRESKEWFKTVCKCCVAGDRNHRSGPQGMVCLRTEADKRDALTLEIADTKSYQDLLDKELAKYEPAEATSTTDLNYLHLINEKKQTKVKLLHLATKLRGKEIPPSLNAIDGVPGLKAATKTRSKIIFKDGSGCRFEEPPRAKLKLKRRRGELKSKLISLRLVQQPNTKPFKLNMKFLRAKSKSAKKEQIQLKTGCILKPEFPHTIR